MDRVGVLRCVVPMVLAAVCSASHAQAGNQATEFAALAIEGQKKTAFGWAYDHPTQAAAEAEALSQCKTHAGKRSCEVVLAWSGPMCGSYYTHKKGLVNGWAIARNKAAAEGNAMNEFYRRGPFEFADITAYACNSTQRGPAKVLVNKPNTEPPAPLVLQNDGWVTGLQLSPDSKTAYTADRAGNIRAWDVATGKQIRTFQGKTISRADLALSPDGKRLVAFQEKTVAIWDTGSGRMIADASNARWVDRMTFSRDGKTIFGIGQPDFSRSPAWPVLAELDPATGKIRKETEFELPSSAIAQLLMTHDEAQFLTMSSNPNMGLNLWDRASGKKIQVLAQTEVRSAAFVNNGKTLIYVPQKGQSVRAIAFPSGESTGSFPTGGSPYQVVSDSSGKHVYSLDVGSEIGKWDADGEKTFRTSDMPKGRISMIVPAANGKLIASGAEDGTVRFWSATTGAPLPGAQAKR
ncbi:DUF4189 domain-containing protein [Imbroritus primus]|uniref:DUF4189 domain-containing protein n=1 Tax=Imbroritus primus TaxID=3058603 RepID=A0ACD3STK5_9BURK|nr:DUF4189 domain-containing protein [Burkholderiaceae bacterium PBA]